MSYAATRRQFLRTLGHGLAASPLAALLAHRVAVADTGQGPLRFVGIYHPHGASSPAYLGAPGETALAAFAPGSVLSPFDDAARHGRSFRDRLIVLEGVDLASAIRAGATGHSAPSSILTGWGGDPQGPSLDQFLAVERGLGAATPLTSLVLAVGTSSSQRDECISYATNGAPLTKLCEPHETFDRAFASLASQQDPAERRALESRQRAQRSVLDFVKGDLSRLSPRLSARERAKLDQHLTSLRDVEKRIDDLTATGGAACAVPPRPPEFERTRSYNGGEVNFEAITNLQVDLLAQALACDRTRFATLWLADLSRGAAAGTGLTGVPDDCHNEWAHTYSGPRGAHYGGGASEGDPVTWQRLGVQHRYSYDKVARLLARLAEHGALDDTIALVSSDMGDPAAHSSRNVPMLIAGGGGLRAGWTLGRRLRARDDCPPDRWYCDPPALVPHNQVLLSIAHAFGATDLTRFGDPQLEAGALPL